MVIGYNMPMPEHNIGICIKFTPMRDGCGSCSIHSSTEYPEVCKGFYCTDARQKMAQGKDPCKGCTVSQMAEEGCCTTDVGFGLKSIKISREDDSYNDPLAEKLANLLLNGKMTPQEAGEILKRRENI
jgi:hypothetical protein